MNALGTTDDQEDLLQRLQAAGSIVSVADGAQLFAPGDASQTFLIPLSGSVRVEQTNESGRQIVLYRLSRGDSCVMTTSCLLSGEPYAAFGYAEGDTTALALNMSTFQNLMAQDEAFRSFVLSAFSWRMAEMSRVIDDLLINRMDLKLARWLLSSSTEAPTIEATHQQIATELGSVREVISRILKEFERKGWVELSRGRLRVLEQTALRDLVNGAM